MKHKPFAYFKSVMGYWPNMEEQSEWLQSRCDSLLEVFVGLELCHAYWVGAQEALTYNAARCSDDAIIFDEPWLAAPSGVGVSAGFLTVQYSHFGQWDFCIHSAGDNGHGYEKSTPSLLIDIDGYGIHKTTREKDTGKMERASINAVRICEERFKDFKQIAMLILTTSLWVCDCEAFGDPPSESCDWCGDLINRGIFNFTPRGSVPEEQ